METGCAPKQASKAVMIEDSLENLRNRITRLEKMVSEIATLETCESESVKSLTTGSHASIAEIVLALPDEFNLLSDRINYLCEKLENMLL